MSVIHTLVRWWKLNHGVGKEMRVRGAVVMPCPHCGAETPVFRSDYDAAGNPISFSVCRWCDGFIEYSGATTQPHEPYASAAELRAQPRRSRQ